MSALEIDWKVLIGQIVNFAILFFVLKIFVYKPFLSLLKTRRDKIEEGINKSAEAEERLSRMEEMKKKMEEKNEDEKKKVLIAAESEAKKRIAESMQKAEEEKSQLLVKARKEAEEIKEKESEEVKKRTIENVFALTEKLLKEKIDEKEGKKIANEFLSKLKV
ncbi:MAG: hypothetical protein WC998_00435 [Candidatus Paceibacterota bacterium]|jgi:F-type H+-transporting ATPase subunit b